jgi:hypothetical protein
VDVEGTLVPRYGNFFTKHLLCMSKSLLAVSLIPIVFSCNNNLEKKETIKASPQTINFDCNYSECKVNSKKLFIQYKKDPASFNKQILLNNIRDSLFTCWLGTPWDFYGTSEEPGKGKIACGYFVTTLLRDMGASVNRVKHAQCASEEMIKAVCIKNSIRRYSNEDISSFIEKIKLNGTGLYIVGLDFHTGFILNDGEEVYFIHANYSGKKEVTKEIAIKSTVLSSSNYKVIGKVI